MEYLSATELKRMFISAYHAVRTGRENINKINVFPVPDQDTGNNLTRTLKGIHDAINGRSYADIHELRRDILDGSLTNASGNVGIIMTSFINGMLSSLPSDRADVSHLIAGMKAGASQSYEAIQEPKEGTILDVIRKAAESFAKKGRSKKDIAACLEYSLREAEVALEETREKMELYRKVSVVDAGAYGFVIFLEGLLEGMHHVHIPIKEEAMAAGNIKPVIRLDANRHEVISLIDRPVIKRTEVLAVLTPFGNSIDIVEANNKLKIHIHTDYPAKVMDHISRFGEVLQMRTYDMTKGPEEYLKEGFSRIGLVTDEGASLPLGLSMELDVTVVPYLAVWDQANRNKDTAGKSIYEQMRIIRSQSSGLGWPKTSQPSPKAYLQAFTDQLNKYQQVLCVTLSSQVSGAYNSALQARKMLPAKDQARIFIPDFQQGIGGQGILIMEANRLTRTGMDMESLVDQLMALAPKIKIVGFVADPIWLAEGGRVPRSLVRVLSLLRYLSVHPVFQIDKGRVGLKGFQFGPNRLAERAHQALKGSFPGRKLKLVINHADNPQAVKRLRDLLADTPHEVVYESMLPPVLGIHTGPDTLVVTVL